TMWCDLEVLQQPLFHHNHRKTFILWEQELNSHIDRQAATANPHLTTTETHVLSLILSVYACQLRRADGKVRTAEPKER
ncbi:MAG: hypothetical protein M3O09_18405, partial [Acidobacteriota bacterium]|nr:hypothetical protein [Acidobacteriota bacterium]